MKTKTVLVAALLVAGTARADRYERAIVLYQSACISCHSVGWNTPLREKDRVDLTRVVDRMRDADLVAFLTQPPAPKGAAGCHHPGLLPSQAEDLVAFLHMRASDPPPAPKIPPPSRNVTARPAVMRRTAPITPARDGRGK